MEYVGETTRMDYSCLRDLSALDALLPKDNVLSWRSAGSGAAEQVLSFVYRPTFRSELPSTYLLLLAYSLFLEISCPLVSYEAMTCAGFDCYDYEVQGLNNVVLRDVYLADFLDHFIYSFGSILPQFNLEFYNLTSVLKSSGKLFKQMFDKQFSQIFSRIFGQKSEAQFFILDIKYRIDNLTIAISEFTNDVCGLKEQLGELLQLARLAHKFLCYMERANTCQVNVQGIDITPLTQLLLENLTYFIQFPAEKNVAQFQDIVQLCQRIAEVSGDILFQSSQLEFLHVLRPRIEFDTPQDSRKTVFNCRKAVVTQLLESFYAVLYRFDGSAYLVEFLMYLASHFYTLVNYMNARKEWAAVSKQDKENIKSVFCGSCALIKDICSRDLTENYFAIISFFDMALTLFSSHIIFLDRVFMDILISIIFRSKQTGLIYKAQSIVSILFKQQCAVNYARSHYSLLIGYQYNHPSSVLDMIYELQTVVII